MSSFSKGLEILQKLEENTGYHDPLSDTIQAYNSELEEKKDDMANSDDENYCGIKEDDEVDLPVTNSRNNFKVIAYSFKQQKFIDNELYSELEEST